MNSDHVNDLTKSVQDSMRNVQKKSDYKKEFKRDHASRKAKLDLTSTNEDRRQNIRKGNVKKAYGKEVHHVDGISGRLEIPGKIWDKFVIFCDVPSRNILSITQ